MKCIYCNHHHVYSLCDGLKKCAKCKRKFSPQKQLFIQNALKLFCQNINALQASKILNCSYLKISNIFNRFRHAISVFLENDFELNKDKIVEYEEFVYALNKKNIYETQSILCFSDNQKIYTVLMPSIALSQKLTGDEIKKFFLFHKFIKLQSNQTKINEFRSFFDLNIKSYRGVSKQNLLYYIKELEFKFNYTEQERIKILDKLI